MKVADSLPLALVLCDLEDRTGQPLTEPAVLDVLLAAAMLAELDLAGRLKHHDRDCIAIRGGRPDTLLEPAEHVLSSRPLPIADALRSIADLDLKHTVNSHLVGLGALHVTTTKRWFRRPTSSWPTADEAIEAELRQTIREHVHQASGPTTRLDILLDLLDQARLLGTIFDEIPEDRIAERTAGSRWGAQARKVFGADAAVDLRPLEG